MTWSLPLFQTIAAELMRFDTFSCEMFGCGLSDYANSAAENHGKPVIPAYSYNTPNASVSERFCHRKIAGPSDALNAPTPVYFPVPATHWAMEELSQSGLAAYVHHKANTQLLFDQGTNRSEGMLRFLFLDRIRPVIYEQALSRYCSTRTHLPHGIRNRLAHPCRCTLGMESSHHSARYAVRWRMLH